MGDEWRGLGRATDCAHQDAEMVTTYGLTRIVCERRENVEMEKGSALAGERSYARGHADRRDNSTNAVTGRHNVADG